MFIMFFLFLINRIPVELHFWLDVELQKHLHFTIYFLSYYHSLPRFSKLGTKIDFFIELDFSRYLGLILVTRFNSEILFLGAEYQPISNFFFLKLFHCQTQIFVWYFMTEIDWLAILNGNLKLHVVPFDLKNEKSVLKLP